MPIANCVVAPDCPQGSGDLLEYWSNESGFSSEHMTLNLISSTQQLGNRYSVMATLFLPSVWSAGSITSLQIGLSKALAIYFNIDLTEVHVVTNIVNPGLVVEAGHEITW